MATLNEVMKDTADAIREKKGTTEKIAPVNFAEEIKSISAGGGESASTIEYLDVRGFEAPNPTSILVIVTFSDFVKSKTESETAIGVSLDAIQMVMGSGAHNDTTCVAVAVDFSRHLKVKLDDGQIIDKSISDMLGMSGLSPEQLNSIPRITKEQFYSLE